MKPVSLGALVAAVFVNLCISKSGHRFGRTAKKVAL